MDQLSKDPCKQCPVAVCCTKVCIERSTYVYEHKELLPDEVHKQIFEEMERDEAINHIRMVENLTLVLTKDDIRII